MDIKNLLNTEHQHQQYMFETNSVKDKIVEVPKSPMTWSTISSYSAAGSPTLSYFSSPSSPTSPTTASPYLTNVFQLPQQQQQQEQQHNRPAHDNKERSTSQTRTPWTLEEDYLLEQGYNQGLSWAMISATYLPHRSRGCCWGRYKTLQSKAIEQREWTNAEDKLLILAIRKNSRLFKKAWKTVAEEVGGRSWKECELRSTKIANPIHKKQHHHAPSF
ncbi:hypothetical protein INT45_013413 [Circinella minor]|uniref:Myb-like domain-containing protein n=1 Tax=Circinella minor TaxID=1195481 RepID=A0A8H7VIB2_9FUNG|nr:hypothetical protein INT45_013413 [Circinella minor]